jgi:hypothetical protein
MKHLKTFEEVQPINEGAIKAYMHDIADKIINVLTEDELDFFINNYESIITFIK